MPKTKPTKLPQCRICFKKLKGNQRLYCSQNCKNQNLQIKKIFAERKKKNPNLELVFWNQEDNPRGKLEWRNIKGVETKPYKIIKKIINR